MAEECCGRVVETRYCPNCGKGSKPVWTLLQHIRDSLKVQQRILKSRLAEDKEDSKWVKRSRKVVEKWAGWESDLLELIEAANKQ